MTRWSADSLADATSRIPVTESNFLPSGKSRGRPALARIKSLGRQITDPVVLTALVARIVTMVSAPLTMFFILRYLDAREQGLWYALGSLLVIANYAELGLGQIILQFSSREYSLVKTQGGDNAARNLAYIYRVASRAGLYVGALVFASAVLAGIVLIAPAAATSGVDASVSLLLCTAFCGALAIPLAFLNSFTEGCQRIVGTNLRRAGTSILQFAVLATVFLAGGKLWAYPASLALGLFFSFGLLLYTNRDLWKEVAGQASPATVSWTRDIWPLQWRYAGTWITGLFVNAMFVPLLFRFGSVEDAGKYGILQGLGGAITGLTYAWVGSRVAQFTSLRSAGRVDEMKILFTRSVRQASGMFVLVLLGVTTVWCLLEWRHPEYLHRLPSAGLIALYVAGLAASIAIQICTVVPRSFMEEPFARVAFGHMALSMLLVPALTITAGLGGAILAFTAANFVIVGFAHVVHRRYWARLTQAGT